MLTRLPNLHPPAVYDVSKFADEHPGGDEVLFSEVGKDATEAFEDVGHSDDARNLLPDMLVGTVEGAVSSVRISPRACARMLTLSRHSHRFKRPSKPPLQ